MRIYDSDIRKALYREFVKFEDFISDPTTKIINEMDVCFGISRIDIAVINGKINGYEIKSEQDTLERLPLQIDSYNKVFDTVTIIVGKKHLKNVIEIVPEWWGIYYIYVAEDRKTLVLERKRESKINNHVDVFYLLQLLWKDELLRLLSLNGIEKGVKSKTRIDLCKLVAKSIKENIIKDFVRTTLKSRKTWRAVPLQQLYDGLLQ
ncbi:sce7726 family protein [Thermosediminibacter litoriperuensis]|nr:sce7726 family protein [Thermosediminibacter litoriperuensis]